MEGQIQSGDGRFEISDLRVAESAWAGVPVLPSSCPGEGESPASERGGLQQEGFLTCQRVRNDGVGDGSRSGRRRVEERAFVVGSSGSRSSSDRQVARQAI